MGKVGKAYYKVDIQGLANGEHLFDFNLDSGFFDLFEQSPVNKGNLNSVVKLENNERLIQVDIKLSGSIELECDKSLELFDHELEINREVIFKYGSEYAELDEMTIQIPYNTDQIDLGELFYEFIILEIPMKKVHPRFQEESEEDELFFSTSDEDKKEDSNESTDPRWSALKDLKK